jgi:hypothetical protein
VDAFHDFIITDVLALIFLPFLLTIWGAVGRLWFPVPWDRTLIGTPRRFTRGEFLGIFLFMGLTLIFPFVFFFPVLAHEYRILSVGTGFSIAFWIYQYGRLTFKGSKGASLTFSKMTDEYREYLYVAALAYVGSLLIPLFAGVISQVTISHIPLPAFPLIVFGCIYFLLRGIFDECYDRVVPGWLSR